MDIYKLIKKFENHCDFKYLVELNSFYIRLKKCRPHPFDYKQDPDMKYGYYFDQVNWMENGMMSYIVILARFTIFMREGDYLSAVRELEDITEKWHIDILREDIYHATIETIEDEICQLAAS